MHSLPQLLERIARFAEQHPFPTAPRTLYEPCEYILQLGGKRLRPALCLMAYELFAETDDLDPVLPAAWAVELFHNFTLAHDDIMDAAPLRRGQPTVHTRWNQTAAILSGDVMLIYAYHFLSLAGTPATVHRLLDVFNRVAIGVCEGQQYDIDFESRNDVSLAEYTRMIELKTAVLLGGALEMGALCAHAPLGEARALYDVGRLAGIAFQIQDDLLDTYGDPAKFGKQVGGDILQNKKTFLVLKTFEVAGADDRAALRHWMQESAASPDEKVAAVRAIFDRNGVPDLVAGEKQRYAAEAYRLLDTLQAPDERKKALRAVVGELLERES